MPARKASALAGFLAALVYCLIAGFAVPAQRTLYMVGVVALALWAGRVSSVSRVLCAALLLVLLLDPWAVLAPGFWLSFGAVAVILYVATGRLRAGPAPAPGHGAALGHSLVQWGRVQWAITLALAPLLLVWFQQMSLVSPLANAVAIPLVSLVVTPLALAGSVLPFDFILKLAHAVMAGQMWLLEWCAALPAAVWQQHAPAAWTVALALAGTAWLLLPRGVPVRWLGLPLMLPMFAVAPPAPAPGALWLTVLDVGQGLAVFVQTERHALLYDAGPAYSPEADSGSRVILPFLRASGIAQLDAMVVSHDDNDHAGGAASVLAGLPVAAFYSSLPPDHAAWRAAPGYRLPCAAGQGWDWDGVRFELLHPAAASYARDRIKSNDRSCVLRIATAHGAVLLTGDIEVRSEQELLARAPEKLRADVLVVPHHSSRTSSTAGFHRRSAAALGAYCRSVTATASATRRRRWWSAIAPAARRCCAPTAPARCWCASTARGRSCRLIEGCGSATGTRTSRLSPASPRFWFDEFAECKSATDVKFCSVAVDITPLQCDVGVVIDFVRCEATTGHRPIVAIRMTPIDVSGILAIPAFFQRGIAESRAIRTRQ